MAGLLDSSRALAIPGRPEAVTSTILQASPDDVIVIAGKGHEDYQIIGQRKLDYSDRLTVARLLGVIA